jgi:hypothetical protein
MIAFDASSNGYIGFAGTLNITHVAAASGYMFVLTTGSASSMTYNGVALSLYTSYAPSFPPGTNCIPLYVWVLQNPSSGSHTLAITTSNPTAAVCVTYTGLNEIPIDAQSNEDSANNQVAFWPGSVTSVSDNCWAVTFAGGPGSSTHIGAGTSTTFRAKNSGNLFNHIAILDSNAVVTPAGSHTNNLAVLNSGDNQSSDFITSITIAIKPPTSVSVTDSISLGESKSVTKAFNLSVTDSITTGEIRFLGFVNLIMVSDSITISETKTVFSPEYNIFKVESITITENMRAARYPNPRFGIVPFEDKGNEWPLGMDDETIL